MNSVFIPQDWGRIIDDARIKAGIHVNDLCKNIGMSATTYTKFEKKIRYSSKTSSAL